MKKQKNNIDTVKEIPDEIKSLFGKFYFYSIVLDMFLVMVICMVYKYLSFYFKIIMMVLILGLYVFMLIDLLKKKKGFMSSFLVMSVILFAVIYSLSILKIFALT